MPIDISPLSETIQQVSEAFGISVDALSSMVQRILNHTYESITTLDDLVDDFVQMPTNATYYGEFIDPPNCHNVSAPEWKIHQQAERQLFYQLEEQKHKYDDDDWESMILNGVAEINTRKEFKLCQPEIRTPLTLELDQSSSLQTFLRQSKSFLKLYSAESLLI